MITHLWNERSANNFDEKKPDSGGAVEMKRTDTQCLVSRTNWHSVKIRNWYTCAEEPALGV